MHYKRVVGTFPEKTEENVILELENGTFAIVNIENETVDFKSNWFFLLKWESVYAAGEAGNDTLGRVDSILAKYEETDEWYVNATRKMEFEIIEFGERMFEKEQQEIEKECRERNLALFI